MNEFNETERESKSKQEAVKQQLDRLENDVAQLKAKTQEEFYNELRNGVIDEVADMIQNMGAFGKDTTHSFALYIRAMKK